MPRSFASRCARMAPSRTWPTDPGPPGASGILHRLDRVDRDHVGAHGFGVRADVGEGRVAHDEEVGRERAQPVGPEPHLRRRLLGAHEQAARAVGGHRAERLQHERALAHARLAADERERSGDQTTAEHAVELGHVGGPPGRTERVDVGEGHRLRRRAGPARRAAAARPPDRLERAPLARIGGSARAISATRGRRPGTGTEQVFVSWPDCSPPL